MEQGVCDDLVSESERFVLDLKKGLNGMCI
jgi:hypothetical protein